jgi:STE24 endopeptidase
MAVAAAVVAAQAAVLLLRPREADPPAPEPLAAAPEAYFSRAELQRAEDFRSGQRWLFGAIVVVELGVLVVAVRLARRPPRRLEGWARRPVRAAAVTAAGLSVAVTVAALPVRAISRERARDVGLVTQPVPGWLGDVALAGAIGGAIAAAGGAVLVVAMRRLGRRWWVAGAVVVVGYAAAATSLAPVVLDPLFNRFTPLPAGDLRADVLELAERAGVEVGEVYEMDASRRTTAANAYVAGLGATKRVVLYDTLLRDFEPREVRLVVAHELAHQANRDLARGLLFLAVVAPFGMLAVARVAERLGARAGPRAGPAAVPAVALSIALLVPVVTAVSNQLSRAVEIRADLDAIRLTDDPEAMVAFERRIALQNVSDPDPPEWWHALMGTHPTTLERIAQAEAERRQ